jgi:NAD(P)-dependent dehydrogenase (short-subunit alcohol dehydrogenase family)
MKQSVLITGGTTGLGFELCKHFHRDGFQVGVCSFEPAEKFAATLPQGVLYYQADVNDTAAMKKAVDDFHSQTGRLDIVIANAGISMHKNKIPDFERGRAVIRTNVIGVLNTFEPAIHIMKEKKSGQLVAISSISGLTGGLPGMAIYGASKSAVYTLCESLDIDLHSFGIKVTTIAPGFVSTGLNTDKHARPFELTPDQAGQKIYQGIRSRKSLYAFPLPLAIVSYFLKLLPRSWYRGLMKMDLLKTGSQGH